jgi:hypothetical protein
MKMIHLPMRYLSSKSSPKLSHFYNLIKLSSTHIRFRQVHNDSVKDIKGNP